MRIKNLLLIAMLSMLGIGVQNANAFEIKDGVLYLGDGSNLYSTGTCFWYSDSVSILYTVGNEAHRVLLEGDDMKVTITKDMGILAIKSLMVENRIGSALYKCDANGKTVALDSLDVVAVKNLNFVGASFIDGHGINYITQSPTVLLDEIFTKCALVKADAERSIQKTAVCGGIYTWNNAYYDESMKKTHTMTINTPEMIYITEATHEAVSLDEVSKGKVYSVVPIIRSGYPFDSAKYNGKATCAITDEKDSVYYSGTITLAATDMTTEYVDSIGIMQGFHFEGEKMTFKVTFPNNEVETYTIGTRAHEHSYEDKCTYDETNHWRKATCSYSPECATSITDLAKHEIYDDIVVNLRYYRCQYPGCAYYNEARMKESMEAARKGIKELFPKVETMFAEVPDTIEDMDALKENYDKAKEIVDSSQDADELVYAYINLLNAYNVARSTWGRQLRNSYLNKAKAEMTEEQYSNFSEAVSDIMDKYKEETLDTSLKEALENAYQQALNPTGINTVSTNVNVAKYIERGNVVIEKNGEKYNSVGQRMK